MISVNAIRASPQHVQPILNLASRVQEAITASGSLQIMGSLDLEYVEKSIADERCFVLISNPSQSPEAEGRTLIGCAFYRPVTNSYYTSTPEFSMLHFAEPYYFLHSVMIDPDVQGGGRGLGLKLMKDFVKYIDARHNDGTVFLDCWAGNDKLRDFYSRTGLFAFVAVVPEEDYFGAVFSRSLKLANDAD